jgi:DUF1680 family protein
MRCALSLLVFAFPAMAAAQAPGRGLVDASSSPYARIRSVGLGETRWTGGFWAERLRAVRDGSTASVGAIMNGTKHSQFLENFRVAAGDVAGTHRGPSWNDGDFFKWLEALCALLALYPDIETERMIDEAIAVIARAQGQDGYLHTPVLIAARNGVNTAGPWSDPRGFELYNLGHLFTAACVHHRVTGKRSLLDVASRAAECLSGALERPTAKLARQAVCPAHYMGAIELYRTTRDPAHLRLARKLFALRELVQDGGDDNQDRIPFRDQREAVGHAVRANYLYAGAADLYLETGDQSFRAPLEAIWQNVVSRKLYITGGCGALYDGASPDGAGNQKSITRIHQAYGRNYQLPNSTAHNETCAAVGSVLWNWRMLQIEPKAAYAELIEQTLLNAILAGVSLDGKRFFYTNTLRQLDQMPAPLRWPHARQEWISCYCCPPNAVRTLAEAAAYAYGCDEQGIWVHLFGSNTLHTQLPGGDAIRLEQSSDYPWSGKVRFTVRSGPDRAWSLRVRVPSWARGARARVGDSAWTSAGTGQYADFRRRWQAGDVLELELPMEPRLLEAHPLVEELRNQVAVQRGPIVYCLESCDLPAGVNLRDVRLPSHALFEPGPEVAGLPGIRVLRSQGEHVRGAPWGGDLYRERAPSTATAVGLTFIPYFAWNNRGPSEMTVWLPVAERGAAPPKR